MALQSIIFTPNLICRLTPGPPFRGSPRDGLPSGVTFVQLKQHPTMSKEELIKQCLYYNGETEYPKGNNLGFWLWEKCWVEYELTGIDNTPYRYPRVCDGVVATPIPEGVETPPQLLTFLFQHYLASHRVPPGKELEEDHKDEFFRHLYRYYSKSKKVAIDDDQYAAVVRSHQRPSRYEFMP